MLRAQPRRRICERRWRRRKGSRWLVWRPPHQWIGRLIRPELFFGVDSPPERLVLSLIGDRGFESVFLPRRVSNELFQAGEFEPQTARRREDGDCAVQPLPLRPASWRECLTDAAGVSVGRARYPSG